MKKRISLIRIGGLAVLLGISVLTILNSVAVLDPVRYLFLPVEDALSGYNSESGGSPELTLQQEITRLKLIEEENISLRELLDFHQQNDFTYAIANVTGYDPYSPSLLYIDSGSGDNVAAGQPVVTAEGVLVGKVIQTSPRVATVELLTDDSSRTAASVLKSETTSGLIRGQLGNTLLMDFVPEAEVLSVGDLIVTSGVEPLVPRGLIIGTVQEVGGSSSELFTTATVIPFTNYAELRIVSVVQ